MINKTYGLYKAAFYIVSFLLFFYAGQVHSPECLVSDIPAGLAVSVTCKRRTASSCLVACVQGSSALWKRPLRCLEGGKWSQAPACPPKPTVIQPRDLGGRQCDQTGTFGKYKVCFHSAEKKKCPDLLNVSMDMSKCSRDPNTHCVVSCGQDRQDRLVCQEDGTWSHLPDCGPVGPVKCEEPEYGVLVDCPRLEGVACEIRCPNGEVMKERVVCLASGFWTLPSLQLRNGTAKLSTKHSKTLTISKCTCPVPSVPENHVLGEDCSGKVIGEKCKVECAKDLTPTGDNYVLCQNDGQWSPLPECSSQTCPPPKKRMGMVFAEDCASKKVGESCEVECSGSLVPFPSSTLQCEDGKLWSRTPFCACSPPALAGGLLAEGSCSRTRVGKSCRVRCESDRLMSGSSFIVCLDDGSWSEFPRCHAKYCPEPQLPVHLSAAENCSKKEMGESCQLACKTGGKFLGKSAIQCKKWGKWSPSPLCSCPDPVLGPGLETAGNCSFVKPGGYCKLQCSDDASTVGEDFIKCQDDASWSALPSCSKKACEKPELPPILKSRQDCSNKTVGESCELQCDKKQSLVGSSKIVCLSTLKWSELPSCGCSMPDLRSPLQALGDCSNKEYGSPCELQCDRGYKLVGDSFVVCLNDGKWSSLPVCEKLPCRSLELPSTIITVDSCDDRKPGEKCDVKCKEGGKLVGKSSLECFENRTWSSPPACACPAPALGPYLKSVNKCDSVMPGERCSLQCTNKTIMAGTDSMTCRPDTTWTESPSCKTNFCDEPQVNEFTVIEGCRDKVPGESCPVRCKAGGIILGESTIQCTSSKTWTDMPECACAPPVLKPGLEPKTSCDQKQPGDACELRCKENMRMTGSPQLTCQSSFEWSPQPSCESRPCSKPQLTRNLAERRSDCAAKFVGQNCTVQCVGDRTLVGPDAIVCLSETRWSAFPSCSCPAPQLSPHLEVVGSCANKTKGDTCRLRCSSTHRLVGNDTAVCGEGSSWGPLPLCQPKTCPDPTPSLSAALQLAGSCIAKTINETCKLSCAQKGRIVGSEVITCVDGTRWSPLPTCTCPPLELKGKLKTQEDCNLKKTGETCKLKCTNASTLVGRDFVTCENTTKWSSLPRCTDQGCPAPPLGSTLKATKNCSNIAVGQKCPLECSEGGTMIGDPSITCSADFSWTPLPKCTCPLPVLEGVNAEDCKDKTPGQSCALSCADDRASLEVEKIACGDDTKWDYTGLAPQDPTATADPTANLPECRRKRCPNLSARFKWGIYEGTCNSMRSGDKCILNCAQGGHFLKGKNFISCEKDGTWSEPAPCSCSEPRLSGVYKVEDDCTDVYPDGQCKISCKNGNELEKSSVGCLASTKWEPAPSCDSKYCPPIELREGMKAVGPEDCSQVPRGESCQVTCLNNGIVDGQISKIRCKDSGMWDDVPNCVCPPPDEKPGYQFQESCSRTPINEQCGVNCEDSVEVLYIRCLLTETAVWSALPSCGCKPPARLKRFVKLDDSCQEKSSFAVAEKCRVRCSNNGVLFGGHSITCQANKTWTASPVCGCAPPPPSTTMRFDGCDKVYPGSFCSISCVYGKVNDENRAGHACSVNSAWDPLPDCFCSAPPLRPNVVLGAECARESMFSIGKACSVACSNAAVLFFSNELECQRDGTWQPMSRTEHESVKANEHPACGCKAPPPARHIAFEGCDTILPSGKCLISCVSGFLNEANRAEYACDANYNWEPLPDCFCGKPKLEPQVTLGPDCASKPSFLPGNLCPLHCALGGTLFASNALECQKDGSWLGVNKKPDGREVGLGFPVCSCPPPKPNPMYRFEGCDSLMPTTSCTVSCVLGTLNERNQAGYPCDASYRWPEPPGCSCQLPPLSPMVALREDCEKREVFSAGQVCHAFCSNGGGIYETNLVECRPDGGWATFLLDAGGRREPTKSYPYCSCATPPKEHYIKYSSCDGVLPTGSCEISCIYGTLFEALNRAPFSCDANFNWPPTPSCLCKRPELNAGAEFATPECASKQVFQNWEVCAVRCTSGKPPEFSNELQCQPDGQWSAILNTPEKKQVVTERPACVDLCPPPQNTATHRFQGCERIQPGQSCGISCVSGKVNDANLAVFTCGPGSRWAEPHPCLCTALPQLPVAVEVEAACRKTEMMAPGRRCKLTCGNGGRLLGASELQCNATGRMVGLYEGKESVFPVCSCPTPKDSDFVAYGKECPGTTPGSTCSVSCKNGDWTTFPVTCHQNATWGRLPPCGCGPPQLPPALQLTEPVCQLGRLVPFEFSCEVRCANGGPMFGDKRIRCSKDGSWGQVPVCGCPQPPPNPEIDFSQCRPTKPGEFCQVSCFRGTINDQWYLCNYDLKWKGDLRCT